MNSEAFHAHLDDCAHCKSHPFDLCVVGQAIMLAIEVRILVLLVSRAMWFSVSPLWSWRSQRSRRGVKGRTRPQ